MRKNHTTTNHTHIPRETRRPTEENARDLMLATTIHKSNTTPHHQDGATTTTPTPLPTRREKPEASTSHPHKGWAPLGLLPQDPTVCLVAPGGHVPVPGHKFCLSRTRTRSTTDTGPSNESPRSPNPHTMWAGLSLVVLLRKEVIQPHLPVRLPCYDFVPIADPTFDGSLHKG